MAGDFTGDGQLDLAVVNRRAFRTVKSGCCWATATARSSPQVTYAVGSDSGRVSWRVISTATASSTWPSPTPAPTTSRCCWATATARFVTPGQSATTPHATPLVADVNGDGTDDVLVVDGAGEILYRQGIPGQPGTFEPPVTVNPGG